MKTTEGVGLAIILCIWVVLGINSPSYAQVVAPPLRLAVLELPTGNKDSLKRDTQKLLADLLTAELSTVSGFELVERSSLDSILREQSLSLSGLSKPQEAVRIGRLIKADWIVLLLQPDTATNAVMSKVLDAKTGYLLDLQMTQVSDDDPLTAARAIARQTSAARNQKVAMKDRLWIGFGGFEDLGVYRRYKDFGERLRTSLSLKYAGTKVSVVERSHIRPLLDELQLGQNGLSADKATHNPQQAFVLVDGVYQAFQDERSKINLVLRMEWISGRQATVTLKEPPGAEVERKVGEAVDRFLVEARNSVVTNSTIRRTEVEAQMKRGYELSRLSGGYYVPPNGLLSPNSFVQDKGPRMQDAIRAFESALFLDPDHLRAKFALAGCYVDSSIDRIEDARDIWREIAATSSSEKARGAARSALAASYVERDNEQAHELLMSMRDLTTNLEDRVRMDSRLHLVRIRLGNQGKLLPQDVLKYSTEAWRSLCELTEKRLGQTGRIFNEQQVFWNPASEFSPAFAGPRSQEAKLEYVGNVVSNLAVEFPKLEPYLVANHAMRPGVSDYWLDRYKAVLARFDKNPESIPDPKSFASKLEGTMSTLMGRKDYEWALDVAHIFERHNEKYLGTQMARDEGNFLIGRLYAKQGRWGEAIPVFERIGQRQIMWTPTESLWGNASSVSGVRAAEICRQQMAIQKSPSNSTIASMLKPVRVFSGSNVVFGIDGQVMWISDRSSFYNYDFVTDELKNLPLPINKRVRNIVRQRGKIWFATADGLFSVNPADNSVVTNGVDQGLLMPSVTSICPDTDRIWVGFGRTANGRSVGGIGYLKLPENRFVGMMSELSESVRSGRSGSSAASIGAQGSYITGMARSWTNSLWVTSTGRLFRYEISNGTWEAVIPSLSGAIVGNIRANNEFVVVSCYEPTGGSSMDTNRGGVFVYNIQTKTHQRLTINDGLPNNDLDDVAIDGKKAWVGGKRFIALIDLPSAKLEKVIPHPSEHSVSSMDIAGDSLWFSSGPALYRLPLTGDMKTNLFGGTKDWLKSEVKEVSDMRSARKISEDMEEVYRVYKTRDSQEYLALQDKLYSFFRRSAASFPLLEPFKKAGTNHFVELTLNKTGRGYDGFRFKCSLNEAADLGWIFAREIPSTFSSWRMLPMEDVLLRGLSDFNRPKIAYTNAPWSGASQRFDPILQFSHDGQLEPGKEYFVWMEFSGTKPERMFVAFDFFPGSAGYLSRTDS